MTPGDVGELTTRSTTCSTTPPPGADGRGRPRAGAGQTFSWRAVAEATAAAYQRAIAEKAETTEENRLLTVDFDRLGLQPG